MKNKQLTKAQCEQLRKDIADLKIAMLGTKQEIKKRYGWQ